MDAPELPPLLPDLDSSRSSTASETEIELAVEIRRRLKGKGRAQDGDGERPEAAVEDEQHAESSGSAGEGHSSQNPDNPQSDEAESVVGPASESSLFLGIPELGEEDLDALDQLESQAHGISPEEDDIALFPQDEDLDVLDGLSTVPARMRIAPSPTIEDLLADEDVDPDVVDGIPSLRTLRSISPAAPPRTSNPPHPQAPTTAPVIDLTEDSPPLHATGTASSSRALTSRRTPNNGGTQVDPMIVGSSSVANNRESPIVLEDSQDQPALHVADTNLDQEPAPTASTSATMPATTSPRISTARVLGLDFDEELTCTICYEIFLAAQSLPCGHTFCGPCMTDWRTKQEGRVCPICRGKFAETSKAYVVDSLATKYFERQVSQLRTEGKSSEALAMQLEREERNTAFLQRESARREAAASARLPPYGPGEFGRAGDLRDMHRRRPLPYPDELPEQPRRGRLVPDDEDIYAPHTRPLRRGGMFGPQGRSRAFDRPIAPPVAPPPVTTQQHQGVASPDRGPTAANAPNAAEFRRLTRTLSATTDPAERARVRAAIDSMLRQPFNDQGELPAPANAAGTDADNYRFDIPGLNEFVRRSLEVTDPVERESLRNAWVDQMVQHAVRAAQRRAGLPPSADAGASSPATGPANAAGRGRGRIRDAITEGIARTRAWAQGNAAPPPIIPTSTHGFPLHGSGALLRRPLSGPRPSARPEDSQPANQSLESPRGVPAGPAARVPTSSLPRMRVRVQQTAADGADDESPRNASRTLDQAGSEDARRREARRDAELRERGLLPRPTYDHRGEPVFRPRARLDGPEIHSAAGRGIRTPPGEETRTSVRDRTLLTASNLARHSGTGRRSPPRRSLPAIANMDEMRDMADRALPAPPGRTGLPVPERRHDGGPILWSRPWTGEGPPTVPRQFFATAPRYQASGPPGPPTANDGSAEGARGEPEELPSRFRDGVLARQRPQEGNGEEEAKGPEEPAAKRPRRE